MTTPDRVAVIGAGPIGLYAAFRLVQAGHRVVVWEKGSIGANVEQWGHVTLSRDGIEPARRLPEKRWRRASKKAPPRQLPSADAFLTGSEFRRDVLLPLASYLQATGRCTIQEHCSVVGLARGHLLKKEGIGAVGDSEGETLPFRALLRRNDDEAWEEAMAVVDCSGTYAPETAQRSGSGGLRRRARRRRRPSVWCRASFPLQGSFKGKRVAVFGGGFSAITTIRKLADEGVETALARAQGLKRPTSASRGPLAAARRVSGVRQRPRESRNERLIKVCARRAHPENRRRAERPQADSDK